MTNSTLGHNKSVPFQSQVVKKVLHAVLFWASVYQQSCKASALDHHTMETRARLHTLTTHTEDKVSPGAAVQVRYLQKISEPPNIQQPLCHFSLQNHCWIWLKQELLVHCWARSQPATRTWQAPLLQSPHMQVLEWQTCSWWVDRHNNPWSLSPLAELSHGLSTPPSIARRQGQFVEAEQW